MCREFPCSYGFSEYVRVFRVCANLESPLITWLQVRALGMALGGMDVPCSLLAHLEFMFLSYLTTTLLAILCCGCFESTLSLRTSPDLFAQRWHSAEMPTGVLWLTWLTMYAAETPIIVLFHISLPLIASLNVYIGLQLILVSKDRFIIPVYIFNKDLWFGRIFQ